MSEKQIVVSIGADISQFQESIKQMQKQMETSATSLDQSLDGVSESVKGNQSKISGALKGIGVAIAGAFAIDKIKDFGVAATQAAANASAVSAQFTQVFGELENSAQTVLDGLGKEFGMLPGRLKPSMSQMTSQFKGLGYDTEEAMSMAERGIKMTADAAAFFDKSFDDANGSLNSFLKGNYEGGEAIGLFANETQMAAFASSDLGLEWKKLGEAEKQLVRMQYAEKMMESSGATGQAARESDNLENQLGNLKAAWTDLLAIIGEPILEATIPILKLMASGLSLVGEKVTAFFDKFRNENGILSGFKESIQGLFNGDLNFGELIQSFSQMLPEMLKVGQSMIQNLLEGITSNSSGVAEFLVTLIQGYVSNMATIYPMMLQFGADMLLSLVTGLMSALPMLLSTGLGLITTLISTILSLLPIFIESAAQLAMGLASGILESLPILISTLTQIILVLADTILTMLPEILQTGISIAMSLIDGILTMLPGLLSVAVDLILSLAMSILNSLPVIIDSGIKLLLALIEGISSMLPKLITAALLLVVTLASGLLSNLPNIIAAGVKIIVALAQGLIKAIPQLIMNIPVIIKSMKEAFTEVDWASVGKEIINGIASGIKSMASSITKSVKDAASGALNGVKGFLGIHSPSRVFRDEVGKFIPEGIAVGISENANVTEDSISGLGSSLLLKGKEMLSLNNMITPMTAYAATGTSSVNTYKTEVIFKDIVIREEADIDKIMKSIQREQDRTKKARGRS